MAYGPPTGDMQAWKRLVDQYGRLIWSITRELQACRKRCRGRSPDDVDAADRAHRPDRAADRVGSWLAATARNECLRHVAARKRIVLVHEDCEFDGADQHGPEVDEALLAAERARGRP